MTSTVESTFVRRFTCADFGFEGLVAQARAPAAVERAVADTQARWGEMILSQNDVPAVLLALLEAPPGRRALAAAARWHTLGTRSTSPHFHAGADDAAAVPGINGVDQLHALDARGARTGNSEDVVFLRTRADRERVTPRLSPVGATRIDTLRTPHRFAAGAPTAPSTR